MSIAVTQSPRWHLHRHIDIVARPTAPNPKMFTVATEKSCKLSHLRYWNQLVFGIYSFFLIAVNQGFADLQMNELTNRFGAKNVSFITPVWIFWAFWWTGLFSSSFYCPEKNCPFKNIQNIRTRCDNNLYFNTTATKRKVVLFVLYLN